MKAFTVKDYSVSKEEFELVYNAKYDMLVTTPLPALEDLNKYYQTEDYISHTDAKRNLFEKVYHWVRNYAIQKKISLINSEQINKGSLLDIGCGTGDFLSAAKTSGWNITGIEPNSQARTIAISKNGNVIYNQLETEELSKNTFDVITLWHVLEHLPNLEDQVKKLRSLLKPKGVLIIAVPNYKSFDANYYKSYWAAYDVPRHLWHFSQQSISSLFSEVNMKVVKTLPMKFDAYYVSLLSEKYKKGKMNPFNAFLTGLRSNFKAKRSSEYSSLIYVLKNT